MLRAAKDVRCATRSIVERSRKRDISNLRNPDASSQRPRGVRISEPSAIAASSSSAAKKGLPPACCVTPSTSGSLKPSVPSIAPTAVARASGDNSFRIKCGRVRRATHRFDHLALLGPVCTEQQQRPRQQLGRQIGQEPQRQLVCPLQIIDDQQHRAVVQARGEGARDRVEHAAAGIDAGQRGRRGRVTDGVEPRQPGLAGGQHADAISEQAFGLGRAAREAPVGDAAQERRKGAKRGGAARGRTVEADRVAFARDDREPLGAREPRRLDAERRLSDPTRSADEHDAGAARPGPIQLAASASATARRVRPAAICIRRGGGPALPEATTVRRPATGGSAPPRPRTPSGARAAFP